MPKQVTEAERQRRLNEGKLPDTDFVSRSSVLAGRNRASTHAELTDDWQHAINRSAICPS
jgi:hypothetical protein